MKSLVVFTFCVLLSSCDANEARDSYEGFYSWGFEVSAFSPCGIDEIWWTGGNDLVKRYNALAVDQYEEVYAVLEGSRSKKGQYGHTGAYDREFNVTNILEMRIKRPGDCE